MNRKIKGLVVFLSIVVIVLVPLLYRSIYQRFSYIVLKDAFVSAEVVGITPSYVSGTVTNMYVKEGDYVKKGQILALIDDTLYKAEVEKKQSKLHFVLDKLKQVDNQSLSYTILKNEADLAKKDVNMSQLMLSYTRVSSPINGIVAKDAVHIGDDVYQNKVIVYLYKPNTLYVKAYIDPDKLKYFGLGKKVEIYDVLHKQRLKGKIESVGDIEVFRACNRTYKIPVKVKILSKNSLYFSEPVYLIVRK